MDLHTCEQDSHWGAHIAVDLWISTRVSRTLTEALTSQSTYGSPHVWAGLSLRRSHRSRPMDLHTCEQDSHWGSHIAVDLWISTRVSRTLTEALTSQSTYGSPHVWAGLSLRLSHRSRPMDLHTCEQDSHWGAHIAVDLWISTRVSRTLTEALTSQSTYGSPHVWAGLSLRLSHRSRPMDLQDLNEISPSPGLTLMGFPPSPGLMGFPPPQDWWDFPLPRTDGISPSPGLMGFPPPQD